MITIGASNITATTLQTCTTETAAAAPFNYGELNSMVGLDQCETDTVTSTIPVNARRLMNRTYVPNVHAASDTINSTNASSTDVTALELNFPALIDMNLIANQKGVCVFTIYSLFGSTLNAEIFRINSRVGVRRIGLMYNASTSKFNFAVNDSSSNTVYTALTPTVAIRNKAVTICMRLNGSNASLWCNGVSIGSTTVKSVQANIESVALSITGSNAFMHIYDCRFAYYVPTDAQCLQMSELIARSVGKYGLAAYGGTAKNFTDTTAHWIWADHLAASGSTTTACTFQVKLYFTTAQTVSIHALVAGSGTVKVNGSTLSGSITTHNSAGSTYTTYTATTIAASDNVFQFVCSVANTSTIAGLLACIKDSSGTTIDVSRTGWRIV